MPEDDDVDFQQDNTIHVHWDGFFDKESGVKFYEVIFDTKCWDTLPSTNVSSVCVCVGFPQTTSLLYFIDQ